MISIEHYIEKLKDDENAMNELIKYARKLYEQKQKKDFAEEIKKRLEKVKEGTAKYVDQEDVWKKLGL